MSPPDTNLETEKKRHKPALRGIGFSILWGFVLLAIFIVWIILSGDEPEGADTQVQPGVGTEEQGE
jgi:hypothetical protein